MFDENWSYRVIVILSLCILLIWTYLTNEGTFLDYIGGKFILDTKLIWQVGIFVLLTIVLFYLMQSTLDYKTQNEVLKKYMQRLQQELDVERGAVKDLKSEFGEEVMRLESFIITISDMAKQISSVLETDELLRVLLRKTIDLLGSQKCAIFAINSKDGSFDRVDSIGYDKDRVDAISFKADEESGQIGLAVKNRDFISRDMLYQDPLKKHILDNDRLKIHFCQPIVHNDKPLAVICVGDISKELTSQQTRRLLSTLANFGAIALVNTKLVGQIREQSKRDGLTWLYNHQYFQERLAILLEQMAHDREALGLLILDVDHFKKFNDTYGHQAGDFVLQKTAEILKTELRGYDIVARYGGEEFVAILPRQGKEEASIAAERIRSTIEKEKFSFEGNTFHVTVSLGVSAFDPSHKKAIKPNILIKQTDVALYKAKETGRNRVIVSDV